MKRPMTLPMKALATWFFLGVPTLIVGHAHGVPECTPLDASEGSQSAAPAERVPLATLAEGFESTTFPPTGWSTESAGLPSPHAWQRTSDPDNVGTGRAAAWVGSSSPRRIDEWLITPVVELFADDTTLKFSWSGSSQWSSVLDASVNIREAGAVKWTSLWSITGNESPADPFIYRQRIVDVSAWIGKRVQFGFRVFGANGASFGLDDIAIGDFVPSGLPVGTSCAAERSSRAANPWRVVALREPWVEDVPFETRTRYLRSSGDGNYVPGPDSLIARVVIVARRGYVEILNSATGESHRLLETPASLPQWSPDGRYISCVVWKSHLNPYQLTVVDVTTSRIVMKSDLTDATESKWSPDSRVIAVSGISRKWNGALLYTVAVPDGRVTVIDSLNLLASHEFSWSPDGRWIVFSRPTQLEHHGETIAADLRIAETATGESWCVLSAPDWAESDPLWITDHSIQITRVRWHDEGDNEEQRLVVDLSHSTNQSKQH